ncbi:MAG: hypothetical protein GF311_12835, partial [Candidatus Lokiarchaeota archaeon]|nr:hypothetical protein [Candidatus Lokiarchaeota archaeon]
DAIKKSIEKKEEDLKKIKKKIEDLTNKNERIIEINKFLIRLRDTCSEASSSEFGEEKIIKGKVRGIGGINVSFSELYELFLQNNIQFKQAEELKSYKAKVLDYNKNIKSSRKSLDILKEYQKVNKRIKVLEQKIKGKSSKLDDYINLETKIEYLEKEKRERKSNIKKLEKERLENKKEIDNLSKLIEDINKLPSKSSLISDLKKLHIDVSSKDNIKEFCKKKVPEIKNEIDKEKNKLNKSEIEKERVEKEIEKTKEKLDPLTKSIKKAANEFGYVQIGEFIAYFESYNQKLKKYLENSYKLQTRLDVLKNDILKVLDGKKPKNKTHLEIIDDQFDTIFKEIYGKKEFFEYVFKDYSNIKQFDIANKSIIFETPGGLEETRDLEEFSSGEKTYAYCRSIISMSADIAKYNIVILDESYALLDHEHSQDLYNFQEEMIERKGITKFINILPLKEDLDGILKILERNLEDEKERGNGDNIELLKNKLNNVKDFKKKVSENGYYQEIHYPEYKRKELIMNVGYGVNIGKSSIPEEDIDEYDKEIPFSFILDGSNIAYSNRLSEKASIRNVVKCKKKLMKFGVPEKYIFIIFGSGVRHHISAKDEFLYNELLKDINVNQAPAERDDDWFIIKYAFDHNSYIITNDRYLDYRKKSPEFADFIKKHSIHYTTLGRDIQFDMGIKEKIKNLISENKDNKSKIREI